MKCNLLTTGQTGFLVMGPYSFRSHLSHIQPHFHTLYVLQLLCKTSN